MTGARELLRRAAANRRGALPRPAQKVENAEGAHVRSDSNRRFAAEHPEEASLPRREAAQPHHANYTALMRSHDRMRTRHLPGQAGDGRA